MTAFIQEPLIEDATLQEDRAPTSTQAWIDTVQALVDAGESLAQIASRLNVEPGSILRKLAPDRLDLPALKARLLTGAPRPRTSSEGDAPRVNGPSNAGGVSRPAFSDPRAACLTEDPDTWFAADAVEDAKAVCRRCPVQWACLRHALDVREPYGVWGGLDETERRELRLRGRVRPKPDGAGL